MPPTSQELTELFASEPKKFVNLSRNFGHYIVDQAFVPNDWADKSVNNNLLFHLASLQDQNKVITWTIARWKHPNPEQGGLHTRTVLRAYFRDLANYQKDDLQVSAVIKRDYTKLPRCPEWVQTAYYCPYVAGGQPQTREDLPYVELPRKNPQHNFMFTGGMNGCNLVVTIAPGKPGYIRVYHDNKPAKKLFSAGGVLAQIKWSDYMKDLDNADILEQEAAAEYTSTGGFNFMWYNDGHWWLIGQSQRRKNQPPPPRRNLASFDSRFKVVVKKVP